VLSLNTLSFDAGTRLVLSVVSYFFHSLLIFETFALANTVFPSALSKLTVTGPVKPRPPWRRMTRDRSCPA